ncbi:uncharacterized protein [Gossypium hirsutum]|uniref:Uncharacterized protein isoform X6 n=1 Tax=Gossypium hirsutum TaxID=3635 RepID=A0ABM2ZJB7_GOSHI|nr:uncharacterized protein LOC121213759 isoform X6 [Gossypium hirsutum]
MNPYVGHQNPLKEGQELFRKGLLSEAVLALEAEVMKSPEKAEGWRLLGITHAENDDDQQAIAAMMCAQEADPTNLEVLLALGVSHTNELEQTAAIKYLYGWLRHHPKYGTLAPPELANSLYYADALDLKPNYVRAWANMGISYTNQYCAQFKTMKIAVEGCMHGDLDKVYDTIKYIENTRNIKIDLLLCYGDFQAVRNGKDMDSLNVATKYREMKSFWIYYLGQEVAPIPTIFIGGNNEASNYLWELYYGGWAAPNIYFLGYAVVVKFGNIRINGLSGIYNAPNYCLGWDTMKGHLIMTILSGLCIMFGSTMFTSSCT